MFFLTLDSSWAYLCLYVSPPKKQTFEKKKMLMRPTLTDALLGQKNKKQNKHEKKA